jgi:hypothetical protein
MGGRRLGALLAAGITLGLALGLVTPVQAGQARVGRERPGVVTEPAKPKPAKPVVKKVKPATGPIAGGTVVKIKGKRFTKVKKVLFGTTKITNVQVKNPRKLIVVAPPHAAGTVSVRVVTKSGKSKRSGKALFTYFGSPQVPVPFTVSGLTPTSGPAEGGTTVDITGTGLAPTTAVSFDGTAATFTVLSDTKVRAVTPAHAGGAVPVRVHTPQGTSAALTFTYEAVATSPPVVALVSPLTGPETGGTAVTVTGTGFTGATAVSFDGVAATFTVDSDTSISATTPAHAAGPVAVSVTTPLGTSTVPGLFTYLPLPPIPLVVLVTPPVGSSAGGTAVTITGTGLTGATAVLFGGTAATSFTVDSDIQITATTPAHAAGPVDVAVTTPGGTSTLPGLFAYLPLRGDALFS